MDLRSLAIFPCRLAGKFYLSIPASGAS